jgi:membrane-associated HD superfamily phosphohydrolase
LTPGGRLRFTGCCYNTHCTVSLQQLTLPLYLNTVLIALAFCPQTAITDVEYLTLQRPLALGNTLSITTHFNRITFCQSCPCASTTGFCNNAEVFQKYPLLWPISGGMLC